MTAFFPALTCNLNTIGMGKAIKATSVSMLRTEKYVQNARGLMHLFPVKFHVSGTLHWNSVTKSEVKAHSALKPPTATLAVRWIGTGLRPWRWMLTETLTRPRTTTYSAKLA